MPTITDSEFGEITVRRTTRSRRVSIRVAPNGTLQASMPPYAPLLMLKRLVSTSRESLRKMIGEQTPHYKFENGATIGKSHTLLIRTIERGSFSIARHGQTIVATLPQDQPISDPTIESAIRAMIIKALRVEAKSYLPKRLAYLATQLDCHYERVRFSHASGRWGSCSSNGTISLNIALMKLPHELIDYVLVHELSHTRHMNHSSAFWAQVGRGDPQYTSHRRALKLHTPHL